MAGILARRLNFVNLHYAYIILCSLFAFIIIYPYGNLRPIDAFFFGVSGNTESGLNTYVIVGMLPSDRHGLTREISIDVKALETYQQLVIYFFPIITNLGFINILVVVVRLWYFEKRLKIVGSSRSSVTFANRPQQAPQSGKAVLNDGVHEESQESSLPESQTTTDTPDETNTKPGFQASTTEQPSIVWAQDVVDSKHLPTSRFGKASVHVDSKSLDERAGVSGQSQDDGPSTDSLELVTVPLSKSHSMPTRSRTPPERAARTTSFALENADRITQRSSSMHRLPAAFDALPQLSRHASVGRNSMFQNLTRKDKELLGGVEYRSLKLLLKIVVCYFFGLHLFGVLALAPWIARAPIKYRDYLESQGQGQVWWAFYSAQTMVDNLGFTLTPDSMISFRDATWPMLVMTFLAFAGNTCYPIFLRCIIWTMRRCTRERSSMRQPLQYLLDHPRRCYTLLFPGNVTWILFGILFVLNFIDTLLIVSLDLHSEELTTLPLGPRILAALFQAASSRHTGTSTFNLAKVNPAVQFSLLVMMYIAIFPIAMSVRASNTYEERALGVYVADETPGDTEKPAKYLTHHIRNQLSFDLWYIFLGTFCICIAEADPIKDTSNVAFTVFSILFEVTSAYGNVGLSLGTNATYTSLCGDFSIFSKLVICAMMLRGRHRGLPYALDHAVMLPSDADEETVGAGDKAC
ncbi:uncharacterized protein LTR77_000029 [Saxophila tyrrhenica]|uniref:Potassium transport protein n=1 Tax=Saxophila tyrrhenica TaxID=1690608 RepID=A0AAV9PRC7_9PEZI|nr:hypothetical protein LTR77_000029 [Saxophila tyrrhenica]